MKVQTYSHGKQSYTEIRAEVHYTQKPKILGTVIRDDKVYYTLDNGREADKEMFDKFFGVAPPPKAIKPKGYKGEGIANTQN